jgi:hypothetical protein
MSIENFKNPWAAGGPLHPDWLGGEKVLGGVLVNKVVKLPDFHQHVAGLYITRMKVSFDGSLVERMTDFEGKEYVTGEKVCRGDIKKSVDVRLNDVHVQFQSTRNNGETANISIHSFVKGVLQVQPDFKPGGGPFKEFNITNVSEMNLLFDEFDRDTPIIYSTFQMDSSFELYSFDVVISSNNQNRISNSKRIIKQISSSRYGSQVKTTFIVQRTSNQIESVQINGIFVKYEIGGQYKELYDNANQCN